MIGKRFSSDDEVLARLRRLEHRVNSLQLGTGTTNVTNITETGVENFIELGDVPQTYAGATGELPSVNAAEDGLEFNPYVTVNPTVPILTVRNLTDADIDLIHQWIVGATPVVKFTHGVDVSDAYKLKWCNTATLLDTCSGGGTWGDNLIICDYGRDRIKNHLSSTLVYFSQVALVDPQYVCSDGTNYYVTISSLHIVKKFLIADNSLLWTIGDVQGSGDDQFDNPQGICTDDVYIYICDKDNYRIKKHLCSTGAFVDKVGVHGTGLGQFISPTGICTDDVHLYITEGVPGNAPLLKKHLCSTLVGVAQLWWGDGHLDSTNCQSICTDNINLFLINLNNGAINAIFKYTLALAWVSDYGANGTGDTQFDAPLGICADDTYLYVTDSGNSRIKKHQISDYGFVAKVGTQGSGDDQFNSPRGIGFAFVSQTDTRTGQLLVLHQDGKFFDVYPKLSLYNHLVFRENSVAAANAIEITAPVTVVSYTLTLPGTDSTGTQALVSNGSGVLSWSNLGGSLALDDLTDVDAITGLLDQDVLTWDAGTSLWIAKAAPASGAFVLDDLTDVDAAAPSDDDIIRFDTASGLWKNEALPAAASHDLLSAVHGDTTAASPVAGDMIYADATPKWTKRAKGTDSQVWTLVSGLPDWATPAAVGVGSIMEKRWAKIVMNNTASIATNIAMTTSATLANDDDNDSNFTRYQTGAASGNGAGIYSTTNNFIRGHHNQTFYCKFKTYTSIADLRFFIGMAANTTDWLADPSNGNLVMLRYVSGTTNFTYITKDGVTINSVDSGLAAATSTVYILKIVVSGDGTSAIFTINGAYSQTVTLKLPAAATPLGITVWAVTQTTAAKSLSVSQIYIEGD